MKNREVRKSIGAAALLVVLAQQAWPQARITAIVNAASFQNGLPSGGSLATVFCSGLPPSVKPGTYVASGFPLPYELAGLGVGVNNGLAPMLAAIVDSSGNAQLNFQVPMERNASLSASPGQYAGTMSACDAVTTQLTHPSGWGGFFADANGYAIAQHASDYGLVTTQNPAHAGEAIIVYADDFFPVWPPPPIAFPTPSQPLFQLPPQFSYIALPNMPAANLANLYLQAYPTPSCLIAGGCNNSFATTPALQVTFEGLAPGQIGVEQINFVVPANQQPGDWALFYNAGSCPDGNGSLSGRCATYTFGVGGSSSPYVKLPVR